MRRTAAEAVTIKPMYNNSNGIKVTELHWNTDGTMRYYYGTSNASTVYNLNDSSNSLKLGIYIDGANNSYSLWANNVLVVSNAKMAKTEAVSLQSVNFTTTTAGTLQFEEYKFYNVAYSYRAVAESGAYKATFYAPEIGGTHSAFKCYLALYDGSELVAFKTSDVVAGSCDGRSVAQIEFTDEEVATFNPSQPNCKAFIWSADSLYTPLAKSKSVTK